MSMKENVPAWQLLIAVVALFITIAGSYWGFAIQQGVQAAALSRAQRDIERLQETDQRLTAAINDVSTQLARLNGSLERLEQKR